MSRPIEERYDYTIRHVSGMGRAVATAILLVMFPREIWGVDTTSEAGIKTLDLWPRFDRGESEGRRYVKINAILLRLCRELGVDLWTLIRFGMIYRSRWRTAPTRLGTEES